MTRVTIARLLVFFILGAIAANQFWISCHITTLTGIEHSYDNDSTQMENTEIILLSQRQRPSSARLNGKEAVDDTRKYHKFPERGENPPQSQLSIDTGVTVVNNVTTIAIASNINININITREEETRQNAGNSASANTNKKGSSYITMFGEHRVQPAIDQLPKWLRDYFAWHQAQVANYKTNGNGKTHEAKYLALTCISSERSERCGGLSDRLRALPFFLLAAAKVDRILCIYWTNPFGLEHLLQPPKGGMDWRCPSEFDAIVDKSKPSAMQKNFTHYPLYDRRSKRNGDNQFAIAETVLGEIRDNNATFVSTKLDDQAFYKINRLNNIFNAYSYQDRFPGPDKFSHVDLSEHIHRVLFEPIPTIGRMINDTMTRLGLVENEYTSVHIRARYPTKQMKLILKGKAKSHDQGHYNISFEGEYKEYILSLANNAVECVTFADRDSSDKNGYGNGNGNRNGDKGYSSSSRPLFFSSDSADLSSYVATYGLLVGKNNTLNNTGTMYYPVSIAERGEIKHLDGGDDKDTVPHYAAGFYPIIEDLFIMGGSRCVAHGIGSFGAFGAGLAGNRCRVLHRDTSGNTVECPNISQLKWLGNVTDDGLLFSEKVSADKNLANERVPPSRGYFRSPETLEWLDKCFHTAAGCNFNDYEARFA